MLNMLVPESVSSKVSLRLKSLRKTASISNIKNAPPPSTQSRRRSASTSLSASASAMSPGSTYGGNALSASSSAESLISEAESNASAALYSSSSTSSSTRTSVSGRSSLSGLDYSRQQLYHHQQLSQQQQQLQQQLQQYYPQSPPQQLYHQHYQPQHYMAPLAPVLEEQHLKRLQQQAREQMVQKERLPKGEAHENRWSSSGVRWRYARQGNYLDDALCIHSRPLLPLLLGLTRFCFSLLIPVRI